MFLGEYNLSFTGQGRIVLPSKFRREIKDKELVLSRGLDGCIWGFAKVNWEEEAKRQLEIPVTDEKGRSLRRYLFSAAEKVSLDEQGRFVIPKILMDYGNLDEEVVVIGAGDHFEIWKREAWENIVANLDNFKHDQEIN